MDLYEEINEAVDSERWSKRWQRYKYFFFAALAAVFLLVGGITAWRNYQQNSKMESSASFWAALEQLEAGQLRVAQDSLLQLSSGDHAGYALLAEMRRASLALALGQYDKAQFFFSSVEQQASSPALRNLAGIMTAYASLAGEEGLSEEQEASLQLVAASSSPLRIVAKEVIALHFLKKDAILTCLELYKDLLADPLISPEASKRITTLVAALEQKLTMKKKN